MSEKESVIEKCKERSEWESYVSFKIHLKRREEGGSYWISKHPRMAI